MGSAESTVAASCESGGSAGNVAASVHFWCVYADSGGVEKDVPFGGTFVEQGSRWMKPGTLVGSTGT